MLSLRKTTLWLGLVGSVSLAPLPALAAEGEAGLPRPPLPPVAEPAQPSFGDMAAPASREVALPEPPPPAPVTLEAAEAAKPLPAIPLPDPAPALAAAQADWLRMALEARLASDAFLKELRLKQGDRESLSAFYAQAEQPLAWVRDGAFTPAALAAVARLRAADEDGLDPADYPVPDLRLSRDAAPAQWAEADLKLSAAVIRYARDARGGRVEPSRISPLVTPRLELPEAGEVLAQVTRATDADAALEAYNPPHAGYRALKAQLAKLRASHPTQPSVKVPKGPTLRVGMQDERVPPIRSRLNLAKAAGDGTVYDERLASAVAAFQKEEGLADDGVLGPETLAALSGPSFARREGELIANMERWRWLPSDLGERHIMVNVPEFRLRLVEAGKTVHETRVIVGKEQSQTPIFSENMKYLVINPSWTVPPSILKKEFLPALASDPYYAEKKGYRIIRRGNRITVQQPPGERNALGYIKFMFPNRHAVYLHDTPNRKLFGAGKRAFSHGCVRVDQPFQLAEEVLGEKWSEERLRSLIGKGERYLNLSRPLPVHLTYFTLAVDEKGEVKAFDDLYGIDRKVREALGLSS
ncbi:L,D-transpeptidase family protein [Microvirga thermotolerans]|uniref:L,D-transpeptidase family protein n=1 Tax=Microvirga thermotolerans TaxID=2651334 RepID=A0A5P9JTH4_9HYPH|nr:L,D-transpeptidase family protein [Microvirga thermotolerans]QFU15429.1 L,D-transpeptidase family protein [Microvirga thermotolerans]